MGSLGFSHVLENLENYDSWNVLKKNHGKLPFFRLSRNTGILITVFWKSPGILLVHGIRFSTQPLPGYGRFLVCYYSL